MGIPVEEEQQEVWAGRGGRRGGLGWRLEGGGISSFLNVDFLAPSEIQMGIFRARKLLKKLLN